MRYTGVAIAAASILFSPFAVAAQGTAGRVLTEATSSPATAASTSPLSPSSTSSTSSKTETVLIPRDTIIVVATLQGYNSYSDQTGAKLRYQVLQDAIVNGHVIAKAGDIAYGVVQGAQAGNAGGYYGFGYKAANLRVSVDEVYNFCGDTIHVNFDHSEYRRRQGMFASKMDVQVVKGQKYATTTDRVQKICGEATNEASLPTPSDAISTADR